MVKPLRTSIEYAGQPYVDEAVNVEVSRAKPLVLDVNFGLRSGGAYVFGRTEAPAPSFDGPQIVPRIVSFSHYAHKRLRWMKPGPDGKLVPVK